MVLTHVPHEQAPIPLTIFRSNSKCDQNLASSSLKHAKPITTKFCTRHDSLTVVTCAKFRRDWLRAFQTKQCKFCSNFKFDRNIVSGTGTRAQTHNLVVSDPNWHCYHRNRDRVSIPLFSIFSRIMHYYIHNWQVSPQLSNMNAIKQI